MYHFKGEIRMTERNYSGDFYLYDHDGAKVKMTVRADGEAELITKFLSLKAAAILEGFTILEPVVGSGEKVEKIAGYVVGQYKDKNAGKYMPCVHLYADDARVYKCATIYPENFGQLPFNVTNQKQCDAPPKIEDAKLKGYFYDCEFEIVVEPELDYDTGEVKRNEKNYIQYKFKNVKGAAHRGGMTTDKEAIAPTESDPHDGLEDWAAQALPLRAAQDDKRIELRKEISLLGNELYPTKWYDVCTKNVHRLTNGQSTELDDLTAEELTRMLAGLNRAKAGAVAA
jgi:hypothetical protein